LETDLRKTESTSEFSDCRKKLENVGLGSRRTGGTGSRSTTIRPPTDNLERKRTMLSHRIRRALLLAAAWSIPFAPSHAADTPVFEDLGVVVQHDPSHRHRYLFVDRNGREISWGSRFSGFCLDTGEAVGPSIKELTDRYGSSKLRIMTLGADGNVYAYYGNPSHFLRYDPYRDELTDLGCPDEEAHYYLGGSHALSDDGVYYVGTYPRASLVSCDTRNGKVRFETVLTEDARQHYVPAVSVNADGVVFAYVVLHHSELAAWDAKTGKLNQLLPEALQSAGERVRLRRAEDGQVYAVVGDQHFVCRFDGLEEVDEIPPAKRREPSPQQLANGNRARVRFDSEQRLLIVHDVEADRRREVEVDLEGSQSDVFCLGVEWGDRIYGGSNHPANVFYYDRSTNEMADYGLSLGVQTYAVRRAGDRLFFTTYSGGQIFCLDPRQPIERGTNPKRVAKLSDEHEQERLYALVPGPDGHLYIPSVPTKGQLGGALTRLDPSTLEYAVYRGIIPNQSVTSVAAAPETGEIFGTSDVRGGTSAHPSEKEGVIFLWDPKTEGVVYQSRPVAGATGYQNAVRAETGVIYCRAGKTIVAFDPVERQVPGIAQLEVSAKAGLTFARGLRTMLRADPDVLLIGEVRDEETARIAIQAAMTGHLVLTTLHTYNAASAVARLKDMGVEANLLATSVNCIVAQRLARRLCAECREEYAAGTEDLAELGLPDAGEHMTLYRPRGCVHCAETGYRGRVAIYEVLPIRGKVRRALGGSTEEIFAAALEQGMKTLRDDGIRQCLAGVTSLDEVRRIAGDRFS
jgi:outer membrane protein assembly factor BamB